MSFFMDAIGDDLIGAGTVKITVTTTVYMDGFGEFTTQKKTFTAAKSCQPLSPDEAQLMGFADYGTNEFLTIFTLKKIPMPSKSGETVMVHFNNKDWYVRRVCLGCGTKVCQANKGTMKLLCRALMKTT